MRDSNLKSTNIVDFESFTTTNHISKPELAVHDDRISLTNLTMMDALTWLLLASYIQRVSIVFPETTNSLHIIENIIIENIVMSVYNCMVLYSLTAHPHREDSAVLLSLLNTAALRLPRIRCLLNKELYL